VNDAWRQARAGTLDPRYAEALYQYAQVLRKLDKPAEPKRN
jgi:hypothetical protein